MPAGTPVHHLFVRDDILPSWFANALQEMINARPIKLRHGTTTTVRIDANAAEPRGLMIEGRWRIIDAPLTRAVAGAAGRYSVWAVAADNDITNAPQPNTDATDYAFDLRIVAGSGGVPAAEPGVWAVSRKIGEVHWNGAAITRIFPSVGEPYVAMPGVVEFHAGPIDADHPLPDDRALADGTLANIADLPGLFGAIGHSANGGVDPGGGQFRKPDGRGRQLVGVGPHADVAQAGRTENGFTDKATDEGNLAARRPRHVHTVADHTHALPDHTHNVPAHFHGKGTLNVPAGGSHTHTKTETTHNHGGVTGSMNRSNPHDHTMHGEPGNVGNQGAFVVYSPGAHNLTAEGHGPLPQDINHEHSIPGGTSNVVIVASTHAHPSTEFAGAVGLVTGANGDAAFATAGANSLPQSGGSTPGTDAQGGAFLAGHHVVYV